MAIDRKEVDVIPYLNNLSVPVKVTFIPAEDGCAMSPYDEDARLTREERATFLEAKDPDEFQVLVSEIERLKVQQGWLSTPGSKDLSVPTDSEACPASVWEQELRDDTDAWWKIRSS